MHILSFEQEWTRQNYDRVQILRGHFVQEPGIREGKISQGNGKGKGNTQNYQKESRHV